MLNIVFLLVNLALCLYFIYKRNYAILGYIILFQEIHLIPFNNLGLNNLGYAYYILIVALFLFGIGEMRFSKSRIVYLLNSKVIWSLALISFIVAFHATIIGLQSEEAKTLVFRYFVQVLPAMIYLILILDRIDLREFIDQLGKGIIIYGILLAAILLTTTDAIHITEYQRNEISDNMVISPLAITRTGCTMFITALMLYLSKDSKENPLFILVSIVISVALIFLGTSRGPMASTIIALLSYFWFRKKSFAQFFSRSKYILPFVVIAAVFVLPKLEVLSLFSDRVDGLENFEEMRRYLRYLTAYDFYSNQVSFFSTLFIFGAGPAGFNFYFGLSYAHNFLLELIFEYGLFGIISATLFITYSLSHSFRLIRSNISEKYLFIPLIVIYLLIASMFSGDLIGWRNLFFVSIILEHIFYQKNNVSLPKLLQLKMDDNP